MPDDDAEASLVEDEDGEADLECDIDASSVVDKDMLDEREPDVVCDTETERVSD